MIQFYKIMVIKLTFVGLRGWWMP